MLGGWYPSPVGGVNEPGGVEVKGAAQGARGAIAKSF
jgi:hypothetical protein